MSQPRHEPSRVVSLNASAREAMDFVRWAAKEDLSLVRFGTHAKEQMSARGLVVRDIERVLKFGDPIGAPEKGTGDGEIKIVVSYRPKGSREIAVVTIVVKEKKKVFVKTVFWKDER